MKTLSAILSHPVAQLISFTIIMIGGQVFIAPFGWMVRYALPTGESFAIVGIFAIAITACSMLLLRRWLQALGLALMWLALVLFFAQVSEEGRSSLYQYPIEWITMFVFIAISVLIIRKQVLWKNY